MLGSIENYNTAEVAKRLGVTDQSVRNFCKRGWLKFVDVASSDSSCPIYQFTDSQINEFLCNFHYDMESCRYKRVETVEDAENHLKELFETTEDPKSKEWTTGVLTSTDSSVHIFSDNPESIIKRLKEENRKLAAENDRLTALLKRERLKTREFINNAINLLIPLEED